MSNNMIRDVNYYISHSYIDLNVDTLILSSHIHCLNGIEKFKNVEILVLEGICFFEYIHELKNLSKLTHLYIPLNYIQSLNEIELPLNIKKLFIRSTSLKNIDGIDKFKNLNTLSLQYTFMPVNRELILQINKTKIQKMVFPFKTFNVELLKELKIPHINIHPDVERCLLNSKHLLEMPHIESVNDMSDISTKKERIKYMSNLNFLFKNIENKA